MSYHTPRTRRHGHTIFDCASALQKAVRRGDEEAALYWATELDDSGYGEYAWKRLRIMSSEDVGLAEPGFPAVIRALYDNWCDQRKKRDEKHGPERLFFVHAVLLLARAQKSRMVDHALWVYYSPQVERREVPDEAFDKHTVTGRRMGRGWEHFFEVGEHLENRADLEDPYEERGRAAVQFPTVEDRPPQLFPATAAEG